MSWFKTNAEVKEELLTKFEAQLQEVTHYIVSHGKYINRGQIASIEHASSEADEREKIRVAVTATSDYLRRGNLQGIEHYYERVRTEVERTQMINSLTDSIYNDKIEVVRSRMMVKAVRAGLDRHEVFYKIMDATSVSELDALDESIDQFDASKGAFDSTLV